MVHNNVQSALSLFQPYLFHLILLPSLDFEGQEPMLRCYSLYLRYTAPTHRNNTGLTHSSTSMFMRRCAGSANLTHPCHGNDISAGGKQKLTSKMEPKEIQLMSAKLSTTEQNSWDILSLSQEGSVMTAGKN